MKVLVACEFSGVVRDAFIARGHDAMSCDLLATESPGPHYEGPVEGMLQQRWDLVIAHPPCQYLANSGVRWRVERGEWAEIEAGARFFLKCLGANGARVCVENPVMHKHAVKIVGRRQDFTIQPWQFGHGETKRTCFWTRGLPPLKPTNVVSGRKPKVHYLPPGPDRWRERSRTYPGVAEAMADQWGSL